MRKNHPALLRAACRYFGSWKDAVEFAGLDYSKIPKYKTWTKAKIIERIQELHRQEVDLSWRNISTKVDPALAAAAVRANRFGSWRAALELLGLNYDEIRRYREWDESLVIDEVRELAEAGEAAQLARCSGAHAPALPRGAAALRELGQHPERPLAWTPTAFGSGPAAARRAHPAADIDGMISVFLGGNP